MSDAREQILGAIHRAGGRVASPRTGAGRQALLPPRFVRDAPDLVALFIEKLGAVSATHALVPDIRQVPAHVADWLTAHTLPTSFTLAPEPNFSGLDWASAGLKPAGQTPDILAPSTVVSGAFAGVAETGSLALLTNAPSRPAHNVLADSHIVILRRARILPTVEYVWREVSRSEQPRSLAFVTGPSRTADIEMSMELGVHGAVRLHVIVI